MRLTFDAQAADDAMRGRAALAIARATGVPVGDARTLLDHRDAVPMALEPAVGEPLVEQLRALGVSASLVAAPATRARCPSHPLLVPEVACSACGATMCAVCEVRGDGRCAACTSRRARSSARRNVRVAVLLLILAAVGAWATLRVRQLDARTRWIRSLEVSVVLLSTEPVPEETRAQWQRGLGKLEDWFADEWTRYRGPSPVPMVTFTLERVAAVSRLPEPPSGDTGLAARAQAVLAFTKELEAAAPGIAERDVTLFVELRGGAAGGGLVEGIAEAGGRRGLVQAQLDAEEIELELVAVAHEVLHCVGATDKYDADGHAREPEGLAEPDAEPRYPQRWAEVMVGEVPTGPGAGEPLRRLGQARIGPVTAREIHW